MNAWTLLRETAQSVHRSVAPEAALVPAVALIDAVLKKAGISLMECPPGSPLLDGGDALYDEEGPRIFVSKALNPADWAFHVAHELGHHYLHNQRIVCDTDAIDVATPANPSRSLVGDEDDYNPKERKEAQANLFARELLLPADKLHETHAASPVRAAALASELGVPHAMVLHQLADTLVLPALIASTGARTAPPAPDGSQKEAVEAGMQPMLVRAGPGTGKTRTLVARIGHLIEQGVPADRILALTFSNDSAADLSARIRAEYPDNAAQVWTGTFHAFGLELLRKFGDRIGLPLDLRLLDRPGALFKMESLLAQLDLDYYVDLYEPLRGLKSVLNAVGRAKDELCSAQRYTELAEAMDKSGSDPIAAAKAAEVARCYRVYDAACRAEGVVDFGDLIARSVELLTQHPGVRDLIRSTYPHVLVDEYQDMNAASRQLLNLLVEPGAGPWVVGDVRQSIYRFRGASPLNITRFPTDFTGAKTVDLGVNYRSFDEIIGGFHTFGRSMKAASVASGVRLKANRGPGGEVRYCIAATREAEAQGIAQSIAKHIQDGGHARDCAILGRTHGTLVQIAEHLERCGIPALYFGNFFERPEIRDLLCVVSIASEYEGLGILRIASQAPYSVSKDDIVALLQSRRERKIQLLTALRDIASVTGLSDAGRAGLQKLAEVFTDVKSATPPAALLLSYLFDHGAAARVPLSDDSIAGQQKRLAVYQLIELALSMRPIAHGTDRKRAFLHYIRTLEVLDEEKELRKPPPIASQIDAVQVMTVHASKGLEFPRVHVPSLSKSYFPANNRYQPCPLPPGLVPADPVMSHDAEEEGLFFVALSRAQDRLDLSRSLAYGGALRKDPSPLLLPLASVVDKPLVGNADWIDVGPQAPPWKPLESSSRLTEISVSTLDSYLECPRRYYYQERLGLRSAPTAQPHLQMMTSVRACFSVLRDHKPGDEEKTAQAIEDTWTARGPVEHALAPTYRAHADRMIQHARTAMRGTPLAIERSITLPGVTVNARADHILQDDKGIVIQRLKMGRLSSSSKETMKSKYAVLQASVRESAKAPVSFEHVSLLTGERREETPSEKDIDKVQGQLHDALDAIAAGRFDPTTKDRERRCPTCPYFFLCPADGDPVV